MLSNAPIFIHSWWRSGSTYVWSKLRDNEFCRSYFEPLNPSLAELKRTTVESEPDVDDTRNFRHPALKKHYFAEYAELLGSGDLKYSTDLAYDRYLLQPDEPDERLRTYLNRLISSAVAAKRRPVLCFCRSQMRSAWMRQALGGSHVAQIRNPADQWASFKSYQLEVRPNFTVDMALIALKLRQSHPSAFVHIPQFEEFAQQLSKRASIPREILAHHIIPLFVRQHDLLGVFLLIWIASALQALSHCDLVLDIDELSTNRDYRNSAAQWFASNGLRLDFSDCSSPTGTRPSDTFEREVENAAQAVRSNASCLIVSKPKILNNDLPVSPLSRPILELAVAR